jgi:hypothetical protein
MLSLWAYNYNWGGTPEPIINAPKGGIPFEDAKRYREYLEKLNGIKQAKEITPDIIEAAQAITEIPIETKQVLNLIKETPSIDFKKLSIELSKIQRYIDQMELATIQAQRILREQDDEMALLLLI